MNNDLPTYNCERTKAIAWARGVLTAMLEVSPLSYWQKKQVAPLLKRMPDWLMASSVDALSINYMGGFKQIPDMAEQAKSDTGRSLAQRYLESHDAVPMANILNALVRSVVKQANEGDLLVDGETVKRQVCALALAGCISEGADFVERAKDILGDINSPNHPLVDYHMALINGDKSKIEALDAALTGGRYGEWVAERLTEAKRYLGLEPPHFTIRYGERTPQWDLLWQRIFTGGDDN
ncbi:MAG: hypothetical protein HY663_03070 [Chloroflexi bacterium]|nr:hypothetical protein [Chloroflexota bacterium]